MRKASPQTEGIAVRGIGWWLLLPIRLLVEIPLWLFDWFLNRFVIAGLVVGLVWIPLHYLIGLSFNYWYWPTVILGIGLTGLWEGCEMFTLRPLLPSALLLTAPEKAATNKTMDQSPQ